MTTALAKTSKSQQHKPSSDTLLWLKSQAIDYALCLCLCFSQMVWGIPWVVRLWYTPGIPLPINLTKVLILQGLLGIFLLYLREQMHFRLLGDRVAKAKNKPLTRRNWLLVFRTCACLQAWIFFLDVQQWIYRPTGLATLEFWESAFFQLYALLILRDVFLMRPFHGVFHHNKSLYHLHKTHHQVLKDAQGMHAFHIDLIDLLVENIGAYALLLLGQYLVGVQLGIHWFAVSALLAHDGALHSVNPHSSLYFNPILDYLLKPNIHHQLHHALNDGYLLFVPFQHLDPSRRQADKEKYNQIFKTSF